MYCHCTKENKYKELLLHKGNNLTELTKFQLAATRQYTVPVNSLPAVTPWVITPSVSSWTHSSQTGMLEVSSL